MKTPSPSTPRLSGLIACLVFLCLSRALMPSALAANGTWLNTGATDANWNTTSNWIGDIVPGSTAAITGTSNNQDTATFNTAVGTYGTSGSPILMDSASENLRYITFDTSAGSYTLGTTGGNPLYMSSGSMIKIASPLTTTGVIETINAPLVLENLNPTCYLDNSSGAANGTLIVNGGITGGKAGTTAKVQLQGSNLNDNTVNGVIADGLATSMSVVKSGAATWVLSAANTYSGTTTLGQGTVKINAANNLGDGSATNSIIIAAGGGTLESTSGTYDLGVNRSIAMTGGGYNVQSDAGTLTISGNITNGANALTVKGAGDTSISGAIGGGNGTVYKTGLGTATLSGANTYTGVTTLNEGTLTLSGSNTGNGGVLINPASGKAATLNVNNANALGASGTFTINAPGTVTIDNTSGGAMTNAGNNAITLASGFAFGTSAGTANNNLNLGTGAVSDSTNLTITLNGGGALTFGGVLTNTKVGALTLTVNNGIGTTSTSAVTFGGFALSNSSTSYVDTIAGTGNVNITGPVTNGGTATASGLTKTGASTLTLSGANTYSGATSISQGVLKISATNNLGDGSATNTISMGYSATLESTGNSYDLGVNRSFNMIGNAFIQSDAGTLTISGAITNGTNLQTVQGAGDTIISGVIGGGTGGLAKSGTGTLTLSGTNTYTGGTAVNGGILTFLNTSAKASGTVTVAAAGAIGLGVGGAGYYSSADVDSLFAGTLPGFSMNAASGVAIDTSAGNFTYTTNQSAARALTKLGANALTLSGANTYNGGTTVTAGTLILASNSAAGSAGIVLSGASSSTLQINSGVTIANNITCSNTNAGSSVNRQVANAAAYTVGTSGSLTSAFAGGQADTTASILAGTNAQGSPATLAMSFTDTSAASNDALRKSDVFTLSGTATDLFVLQLNVTGLDSASYLGWLNGSTTWANAVSGNTGNNASAAQQGYLGSFSAFQVANGATLSNYIGAYGVDISGGSTWAVLNHNSDYAAVPEPGTWALLALTGTFFMVMRRRRFMA